MEMHLKQEETVFAERTSADANVKSESDFSTKQLVPLPVEMEIKSEAKNRDIPTSTDNRDNILSPLSRVKCEIVEYETPIRDSHSPTLDFPPNPNPNNSDTNMVNIPFEKILKSEYGEMNCSESNITFDKYDPGHGHGHSDNNSDSENDNEHDPFADIECGIEPSVMEQLPQNNNGIDKKTSSDNNTKLLVEEENLNFLKCPECPYSCSDTISMKWHLRNHSSNSVSKPHSMPLPIKFYCPNTNQNCINTSESVPNTSRHLLYDWSSQLFTCSEPYCKDTFEAERDLLQHIILSHSEADPYSNFKPFSCSQPNCTKSFKSKGVLNRHMKLHSSVLHVCPEKNCGKIFKLRQYLSDHLSRVHSINYISRPSNSSSSSSSSNCLKIETKAVKCDTGSAMMSTNSTSHMTDSISISTLNLTSTSTSTLTSKPYKCTVPYCEKSFTTRRYLLQHSVSHSEIRPFECSEKNCTKAFKLKGDLNRHQNSCHSYITPFICPQANCGKRFKLKQYLSDHFLYAHSGRNVNHSRSNANNIDNSNKLSDTLQLPSNSSELKKSQQSFLCGPVSSPTSKAKSGNTMMTMEQKILNSKLKIMKENKYLKKPFQCSVCQLSFHGAFLLTHHLKTHADDKVIPVQLKKPSPC